SLPDAQLPTRDRSPEQLRAPAAVVDLLRTLLRLKAEEAGVAGRVIASADEIDRLAARKRHGPALPGRRSERFRHRGVRLIERRLALPRAGDRAKLIPISPAA